MGQGYLIDTNVIIDYLGRKLPANAELFLDSLLPKISVVTRMEVLGWQGINAQQLSALLPFFNYAIIYAIDEMVVLKTIELRQQFKIKLPDAIIAATALVNGLDLITRNIKDFNNFPSLQTINPWDM